MASVPHFHSGYSFSDNFSNIPNTLYQDNYGGSWPVAVEENFPAVLHDGRFDGSFQPPELNGISPEIIGISSIPNMNVVPSHAIPDNNCMGGIGGIQNVNGARINQLLLESGVFGEDCHPYFQDHFKAVDFDQASSETWGMEHHDQCNQARVIEDNSLKIGRYSGEERKSRILRYLKKRNQRNFNKTIKYACRKTLADRRVRVRGRFARNSASDHQLCEEETVMKKEGNFEHNEKELCCGNEAFQIKEDDDECWLQEAMANLMYLPYVTG